MTISKTIICLANSRKTSGRCFAGKAFTNNHAGEWIRPISERESHEISDHDCKYSNGQIPEVFDIIKVPIKSKYMHPTQKENHTIDNDYYWSKEGRYIGDLRNLVDNPDSLWSNGYSSFNGRNDRVPTQLISVPCQSLYFIYPEEFSIIVQIESSNCGPSKKKVRAAFTFKGVKHILAVTDPMIEALYKRQDEGEYLPQGRIFMTISLGEPWKEYYYKLAAGIFRVK